MSLLSSYSSDEARALLKAAYALLAHHNFIDSAQEIFEQCKTLLGATAGYVALLSEDGTLNEVVLLEEGDYDCKVDPELPMPIRGFRSDVYRQKKTSYVNEFMEREGFVKFMPPGHVRLENVLFAPLMIDNEPVGLLGLSNKEGGFTDDDAALATRFANLAAVALFNSRMIDKLEESEQTLRGIASGAFDCITLLDSEGRIQFINQAGCRILGSDTEYLMGKSFTAELGVPGMTMEEGLSSFSVDRAEARTYLESSVSHGVGPLSGMSVVIVRDVSERVQEKRELELARRKLEMMGKVTRHDVMNHLTVLEGFANLFFDENIPMRPEHGDIIKMSLSKMRGLFDLQKGYEELGNTEQSWNSLTAIIEKSLSLLQENDKTVEMRIGRYKIYCDDLFGKAIYNIAHNCMVHATGSDTFKIEIEEEGGKLKIILEDNGKGVPVEHKKRIFDLGFGQGSGQGLFLVKDILEVNGMTIIEDGAPGEGARFIISVPSDSWCHSE